MTKITKKGKHNIEVERCMNVRGNSRDCPIKSPIIWGFLGLS
jgi:hypothetical protein